MRSTAQDDGRRGERDRHGGRDRDRMRRAIELAVRGRGRVEPNPCVGAVVAKGDRVLAEGYHRDYGGPHAEAAALAKAGERARGATLWVTLEPCSTTGKTPPCTDAVLRSGVKRVVVGSLDPNSRNRGGVERLRRSGIEVDTGVLVHECDDLLGPFRALLDGTLPFVTVKWAMTLDGQVATRTGASRWITSTAARREGHRERARSDAIVVGIGTVLADDPSLDTRHVRGRNPVRVVLDSRLRLPLTSRLVGDADRIPVVVVTTSSAPDRRASALEAAGCRILRVRPSKGRVSLRAAFVKLRELGYERLLVEGGPELTGELVRRKLASRVMAFVAARFFGGDDGRGPLAGGGRAIPSRAFELTHVRRRSLGDHDTLIEGIVAG